MPGYAIYELKGFTTMKYEDFRVKVLGWAKERNILDGSDWKSQLEKWGEERAEMLHAQTQEEFMDAIGDQAVCLTIVDAMYRDDSPYAHNPDYVLIHMSVVEFNILQRDFNGAIIALGYDCDAFNVDFEACLAQAWDAIKDRKGKMINGKFVKEV